MKNKVAWLYAATLYTKEKHIVYIGSMDISKQEIIST